MKKLFIVFSVLIFLTACGKKKLDIAKAREVLNEKMQVEENEKSLVESKYGIDLSNAETFIMATSKDFDSSDMYLIVLPKKNNKQEVKEQIDTLITKYQNQWSMGYFEEEEYKVKKMLKEEYGDYLIYIVSSDSQKLFEEIK